LPSFFSLKESQNFEMLYDEALQKISSELLLIYEQKRGKRWG
jgi:hypothetical protein